MDRDRFVHCTIHGLQQDKYREEKTISVRQHDYVLGLQVGESAAQMKSTQILYHFSDSTFFVIFNIYIYIKVKCSRYRPGVTQRVGRGIALLFHGSGTRRGSVVSSTPRPHFTPGKDPVPILQEAGWAPGPVWAGGKSRFHQDSIPDRPARSQLYIYKSFCFTCSYFQSEIIIFYFH